MPTIGQRILTPEEKKLKKLLSPKGIAFIYNKKRILSSFPFWASLILTGLYITLSYFIKINQEFILKYFIEKFISIFPNLIGFTLGGYAIIVGFGNTDFLQKIAWSGKENDSFSIYEILNAIFAFNLVCQIFVLILSLGIDFSFAVHAISEIEINASIANAINFIAVCVLIFFATWALFIVPYLATNIFIFGETYHTVLKNNPKPPGPDNLQQ